MAYDKYTWQTGEVITAEKLNHIEDGIADMGGGDAGYECTETVTELFDETVTTVAQGGSNLATLAYSTQITADTLELTFDGVKHVYEKQVTSNGNFYGTPGTDPVALMSSATQNMVVTQNAGEHTVTAKAVDVSLSTTPCFERAVRYILPDVAKKIVLVDLNNTTLPQTEVAKMQKAIAGTDSYMVGVYNNTLFPFTELRALPAGAGKEAIFQKMAAQNARAILVTTIAVSLPYSGTDSTVSVETYAITIPTSGN